MCGIVRLRTVVREFNPLRRLFFPSHSSSSSTWFVEASLTHHNCLFSNKPIADISPRIDFPPSQMRCWRKCDRIFNLFSLAFMITWGRSLRCSDSLREGIGEDVCISCSWRTRRLCECLNYYSAVKCWWQILLELWLCRFESNLSESRVDKRRELHVQARLHIKFHCFVGMLDRKSKAIKRLLFNVKCMTSIESNKYRIECDRKKMRVNRMCNLSDCTWRWKKEKS